MKKFLLVAAAAALLVGALYLVSGGAQTQGQPGPQTSGETAASAGASGNSPAELPAAALQRLTNELNRRIEDQ